MAHQWPNLTILITRMNPNLELRTLPGGKLQVELHGLDVYDPTTGAIRSNTTDEIACNGRGYLDTELPYAATSMPC